MSAGMRKSWLAGLLSASLVSLTGCYGTYNELVDPCYPERWNCQARSAVQSRVAMQAKNGLDMEQTLFTYHFEPGSDKITPSGQNILARIATRRPSSFKEVFIQNSFDAMPSTDFDANRAEEFQQKMRDLNERRKRNVIAYLNMRKPQDGDTTPWQVAVSFPSRVGMYSREAFTAVDLMHNTPAGDFRPDGQGGAEIIYSQLQNSSGNQ